MTAISAEEAGVLETFLYQWDKYLEENIRVANAIDPYCVLFTFEDFEGVPPGNYTRLYWRSLV
jgi:hypothetical protein